MSKPAIHYDANDIRKILAEKHGVKLEDVIKNQYSYTVVLPEKTDENKINKALEISHSNFVLDLEKGIDSEVAQGGTNFSGGQKHNLRGSIAHIHITHHN